MSGLPWIPLDVGFPTGEHAVALRVALQEEFAWARVVRLWAWVAQHRADGRIEGPAAVAMIESAAGWSGTPGAFVDVLCLRHIGLLDVTERGFYVHNWHLHCGAHIEKREKDRARHRGGNPKETPRNLHGNSAEEVGSLHGESAQERKRDKEKDAPPLAKPPGLEDVLAKKYPKTQAVLDALRARGLFVAHASQPGRRREVEEACSSLSAEDAATAVEASLSVKKKAWIGWHLEALTAEANRSSVGHDADPLDESWIPPGADANLWRTIRGNIYADHPEDAPKRLSEARRQFVERFAQ